MKYSKRIALAIWRADESNTFYSWKFIYIYIFFFYKEWNVKVESFSSNDSLRNRWPPSRCTGIFQRGERYKLQGKFSRTRKRGKCLATTIETWPASRRYQIARLSPLINCNFGSFPNDQSRNFSVRQRQTERSSWRATLLQNLQRPTRLSYRILPSNRTRSILPSSNYVSKPEI